MGESLSFPGFLPRIQEVHRLLSLLLFLFLLIFDDRGVSAKNLEGRRKNHFFFSTPMKQIVAANIP